MNYKSALAGPVAEAVATLIAKAWLAHYGMALDLVVGGIKGLISISTDAFDQKAARRLIESIGEEACKQLIPVFESDGTATNENERRIVAELLAETLNEGNTASEVLVSYKLDDKMLADAILKSAQNKLALLSSHECALYERVLRHSCNAIVRVASNLPAFSEAAFSSILQSQSTIHAKVQSILDQLESDRLTKLDQYLSDTQRFESQYAEAVKSLDKIELFGLKAKPTNRRYNLSLAYITLCVEPSQKQTVRKKSDYEIKSQAYKFGVSAHDILMGSQDAELDIAVRTAKNRITINELLRSSNKILIRGLAGSGKTTLLQWIAVRAVTGTFTGQLAKYNGFTPFFIRLRSHVKDQHPRPRLVLPNRNELLGELQSFVHATTPQNWIHSRLSSGNAFVLIDGVDEVDEADHEALRTWILNLEKAYPQARFVVTGRTHISENWLSDASFRAAEIQSMLRADIEAFIEHWHAAMAFGISDSDELEEIRNLEKSLKLTLRRSSALRRLATNPLLCAMVCALHREMPNQLPTDRVRLYNECIDVLLVKREEAADVKLLGLPLLSLGQKRVILERIAYKFLQTGVSEARKRTVELWIADMMPSISGLPDCSESDICEALIQRSGIIREPSQGSIDFIHKTFQEFLAAKAVLDEASWDFVVNNAISDEWTDVVILAVALAPRHIAEYLMDKFAEKSQSAHTVEAGNVYGLLAAACLPLLSDVKPRLRHRILQLVKSAIPPNNRTEAKMLARIGDDAVDLLQSALRMNETAAVMSVSTLANIGSLKSMNALRSYADHNKLSVRSEILRSWDYFDRKEYAEDVLTVMLNNPRNAIPIVNSFEGIGAAKGIKSLFLTQPDGPLRNMNLRGISELSQLESLTIDCPAPCYDIGFLKSLGSLRELTIKGATSFLNYEVLGELKELRTLVLSKCKNIDSFDWVRNLSRLTTLSFERSNFASIQFIAGLSALERLQIHFFTELEYIDVLQGNTSLKQVDFSGCGKLRSVKPLLSLPSLTAVTLTGCYQINIDKFEKQSKIKVVQETEPQRRKPHYVVLNNLQR